MNTKPTFPVDGMTKMPAYTDGDPIMTGAFIACAVATTEQPGAVEAFQKETGHQINRLVGRAPIVAMVDKATGYDKTVIAAYFDWVAEKVWGIEGRDDDFDDEAAAEAYLTAEFPPQP